MGKEMLITAYVYIPLFLPCGKYLRIMVLNGKRQLTFLTHDIFDWGCLKPPKAHETCDMLCKWNTQKVTFKVRGGESSHGRAFLFTTDKKSFFGAFMLIKHFGVLLRTSFFYGTHRDAWFICPWLTHFMKLSLSVFTSSVVGSPSVGGASALLINA